MTELHISLSDFELITTDICTTYVSPDAVVVPAGPGWAPRADHCAHVDMYDGVAARVALECDAASAADLTRRMFDLAADEPVSTDEIADALGEIANVVGGNVKSLAPVACSLGLPRVDSPAPARTDDTLCRVDVVWETGRVTLSVFAVAGSAPAPRRPS